MPTQAQTDKVSAALTPLFTDPDFAGVSDFKVTVTQTPPVPTTTTFDVDVPATPAVV